MGKWVEMENSATDGENVIVDSRYIQRVSKSE